MFKRRAVTLSHNIMLLMWANAYHQQLARAPVFYLDAKRSANMSLQKRALDSQPTSARKRARSSEDEVCVLSRAIVR